eukprot:jgi/Galph1/2123/GphlegSOOS_G812.1
MLRKWTIIPVAETSKTKPSKKLPQLSTKPIAKETPVVKPSRLIATRKLDELYLGQQLTAKILKVKQYGCFVDIGLGEDILIHISELSTGFVREPTQEFVVDQEMTVYVKYIDKDAMKVWLTALKDRMFVHPRIPLEEVNVEDIVQGKVFRVTDIGAFVDFGCTCDGFLPSSEIPSDEASNVLSLGKEVETRVIRINIPTRKIWLSILQVDESIRRIVMPSKEYIMQRP